MIGQTNTHFMDYHGFSLASISGCIELMDYHGFLFIFVNGFIQLIHVIYSLRKRQEYGRTNEQAFHRFSLIFIVFY